MEQKQVKHFTCGKNELEKINEGLKLRNLDADSVISITEDKYLVTVWYKE